MRIVVKIGTQSILAEQGIKPEVILGLLAEQIIQLQIKGHQVVLVSSGAVGFGRQVVQHTKGREYGNSIGEKQVLASLGQHVLMNVYAKIFKKYDVMVSQLLLTKQDFQTRKHYLNISRLINELLSQRDIITIINENDSVAIEELMFTDNDELAGLIAAQINADRLIILSNVEGVYTRHPSDPNAKVIQIIDSINGWPNISNCKSIHGRGGMISKLATARKMSNLGIMTHIVSINQSSVIVRLTKGEKIGTTILPAKRKSNIKRWIAYNVGQNSATIKIDNCLYRILLENRQIISILPVGVLGFNSKFKKGDVVEILSPDNKAIGIGIARYDSEKLQEILGQKNKPVFIHYDHLYIF